MKQQITNSQSDRHRSSDINAVIYGNVWIQYTVALLDSYRLLIELGVLSRFGNDLFDWLQLTKAQSMAAGFEMADSEEYDFTVCGRYQMISGSIVVTESECTAVVAGIKESDVRY